MKRVKQYLVIALALLACSGSAYAQIPVTDAMAIAKQVESQVETIAKWKMQYDQMMSQINQAQQMFQSMNGSRGMGDAMNGSAPKFDIPDNFQALAGKSLPGYSSTRSKYPTLEDSPKMNALYDTRASQETTMSSIYSATTARQKQVTQLLSLIDSASDPAAKADLQNRLINEQNAIQASSQSLTAMQAKQKEEMAAAQTAANQEYICKQFKKSGC